MAVWDFSAKSIDGGEVSLSEYRGKVLLIVNVASRCVFTPQYHGLENLYEKYKDQGFAVLGFPCNQFGNQEPGSETEIKSFCETSFRVAFPLFSKVDVNGPQAHPLFEYLKKTKPGFAGFRRIRWNFTKFLVDRAGNPIRRYAPRTKPEKMERELQNALAAK